MQGVRRAAPSAGSGVSASKAAPTPQPPPLGSYLLLSETGSHAHPLLPCAPRLRGLSPRPCGPSPSPGSDSFRPRNPICWEEPPTPHLSSHFLIPIPRSVSVSSSGKPVVIEARRRADNRLPFPIPPSTGLWGNTHCPVQTTPRAKLCASSQDMLTDAS